jgi:hypothetical protein
VPVLALCVLALNGCGGMVNLAHRRVHYDALLKIPAQDTAQLADRTSFYAEVLTRTSTPEVEPYAALRADLASMAAQVDALNRDQSQGTAFEADFDAFAAKRLTVTAQQPQDWGDYQALDGRFKPIAQDIRARHAAFQQAGDHFDALLKAYDISRQPSDEALKALDDARAEMGRGIQKMEQTARLDAQTADFDAGSAMDPGLKAQERGILSAMQEHLIKTEGLLRRLLQDSDALKSAWPSGPWLWTGPGLPDNGQAMAKFWRGREAFRRRHREFDDLAASFNGVGH